MNKDNAAIVIGATAMTFLAFGGLDASDSSARAPLAHKHTKKRLDSNKLPLPKRRSFVEQIIKLRRREIFALTLLRDHHRGRDCQQRSIARAMTL